MELAVLKWALTTHGTNILILILAYFVLRENLDMRYQQKDNCPDDECYKVFLTKDQYEDKEKRMDEVVQTIKDRLEHLETEIKSRFDQVIAILRDGLK